MGPAPGSRPSLTKVRDPRDETGNEEESGSNRVLRGWAWNNNPSNLAAGNSNNNNPTNENNNIGFRVASPRGAACMACGAMAARDREGPIAPGRPDSARR